MIDDLIDKTSDVVSYFVTKRFLKLCINKYLIDQNKIVQIYLF